jgi:hypothetical protein
MGGGNVACAGLVGKGGLWCRKSSVFRLLCVLAQRSEGDIGCGGRVWLVLFVFIRTWNSLADLFNV